MTEPEEEYKLSPMAAAMQWTSRITTVSMEMVLPGLGGLWLDQHWGTQFIAPLGFVFGVTLGMWHLIQLTKIKDDKKKHIEKTKEEEHKKTITTDED